MMLSREQNIYNYTGYIKCGEILRPPSEGTTRPYALKCFHCKEIYLLFEAFIFHIEDHCKNAIVKTELDSIDIVEDKTKQHQYISDSKEQEFGASCIQTVRTLMMKSVDISDDCKRPKVKEEFIPPDLKKVNKNKLLLTELQLMEAGKIIKSCKTRKLSPVHKVASKCNIHTTKPKIVMNEKVKKRDFKTYVSELRESNCKNFENSKKLVASKLCKKKVEKSNKEMISKANDDFISSDPSFLESEEEIIAGQNLIICNDVNEINIEKFENTMPTK